MKGNLTKRSQAGFTLVELAIVMIIIGLLIAGVLKGQELIANAQVTSTVAQAKSMDAATSTFKDTYNGIPGDVNGTRLPNCAVACAPPTTALGDGRLTELPSANPTGGTEAGAYFLQLNAANLLSGLTQAPAASAAIGANYPAAKISGNGFQVGSIGTGQALGDLGGTVTPASNGTYLTLTNAIGAQTAGTTGGLKPSQANRIDTKLDDADPSTGDVRAFGTAGAAAGNCGTASDGAGVAGFYNTSTNGTTCGLYIKIQN